MHQKRTRAFMDNFNIIYKILKQLEKAMDYDEFDMETVSAERLKNIRKQTYENMGNACQ